MMVVRCPNCGDAISFAKITHEGPYQCPSCKKGYEIRIETEEVTVYTCEDCRELLTYNDNVINRLSSSMVEEMGTLALCEKCLCKRIRKK